MIYLQGVANVLADKFSEDTKVSAALAKRIIDNLNARDMDVAMFNRVLYKLECEIKEAAVAEKLNKSSNEDIGMAIDEIIADSIEGYMSEISLSEGEFDENKEYEIITTAKQTDHRYGDFQYSKSDLETMAKNFNENILGTEIPVDLNHEDNHMAYAWIKPGSMKVKKSSKLEGQYSLYAQLHRYTPEGKDYISTGKFRYFSLQIQHQLAKFVDNTKKVYKLVIRAMALTNMPVVKDMAPTLSEKNPLFPNHSTMEKTHEQLLAEKDGVIAQKDTILSEKDAEIKRLSDEIAAGKKAEREATIAKQVEDLCLSDDKKVGFKGGEKDKITEFVKTLSDDQVKTYFEIHKDIITSVDLGEDGDAGDDAGDDGDSAKSDDPNIEAETKAAELSEKEKIPLKDAYVRVLSENPKLAKRVKEATGHSE